MTKPTKWLCAQHPPSLIRVFAVRMKKLWVLSYPLSAQRRLWSDWADAQADLSLRWAHTYFVGFVMSRLICTVFQYEPVITPGNELNFHHVILYRCQGINSSYDGVAGNCYERDRPLPQCQDIIVAWAIGGEVGPSDWKLLSCCMLAVSLFYSMSNTSYLAQVYLDFKQIDILTELNIQVNHSIF